MIVSLFMRSTLLIDPNFAESNTVTVLIGEEKRPFYVQKQLLCEKLPYFKACLKSGWQKDASQPIVLDDVDIEGFRVLLQWLFDQELPMCSDTSKLDWNLFDKAYQTGDRLVATKFQNRLIDSLLDGVQNANYYWSFNKLEVLRDLGLSHTLYYQLVPKNAISGFYEARGKEEDLVESLEALADTKSMLQEVVQAMFNFTRSPWSEVYNMDLCKFHSLKEGNNCSNDED